MATSMRPAWVTTERTAFSTEASLVTSSSTVWIASDSLSARARSSAAFFAFLPPRSRMLAKTVWPWRASVSANRRPKPVLEPVIRMTCLEDMGTSCGKYRGLAEVEMQGGESEEARGGEAFAVKEERGEDLR